jgi:cell division protein FtsL
MIRLRTLFWLLLVSATSFAMFGVKYQVQALEDELARINRATAAGEHEIRVLDAEWAYLTRPESLEAMNRQFLSLVPISTKQLRTTVADIPMRPPLPAVPAPVEAATMVAAAEPAATPSAAPNGALSPADEPPAPIAEPASPAAEFQTKSALRAMPALLEKPAAMAQLAKPAPVKAAARSSPPHRAKSIDDLISQIMTSR